MAVTFHRLTVSSVFRLTNDAVSITFDVPTAERAHFAFQAGQYVTVKAVIDGVEQRRSYSICSSPALDEPLAIGVKRVDGGMVSTYLHQHVTPGQTLELYPPMGRFTLDATERPIVFYAGGSGITPILSMTKSVLATQPNRRVTLIYANRATASVMFADAIESLQHEHPERLHVVHVLEDNGSVSSSSYAGRLDTAMARTVLAEHVTDLQSCEHYICGPQAMMDSITSLLNNLGVASEHIHHEYFTITKHQSDAMNHDAASSAAESAEPKTRTVTIRLYGTESTFSVEPDETILTAAQRANLDPPFACQIGACCTCRAKLLSGKVVMDEREALSDDEINEGYILTCQSHPITDDVIADYDQ